MNVKEGVRRSTMFFLLFTTNLPNGIFRIFICKKDKSKLTRQIVCKERVQPTHHLFFSIN